MLQGSGLAHLQEKSRNAMLYIDFFYSKNVYMHQSIMELPLQAVQLTKFDYRLSNLLDDELQKLRCRVNYHALRFTDPILEMGRKLVERMRKKSNHFVALHLR